MSASWIAPDALSSRASLYWPSSTWILATGIGSLQGCAGSVIGTSDPCCEHFYLVSQPVDVHLVRKRTVGSGHGRMHLAAHRKNSALAFNRLVDMTECYARPWWTLPSGRARQASGRSRRSPA